MAVQTITEPPILDSTGQQIVSAIQELAASQNPEAKNVSQTAISGVTNVDDALSYLKDEVESVQGNDVKTVNSIEPDEHGNVQIDEVQFAKQIVTDDAQQSSGTYIERTTGGDASLSDGDAQLIAIFGRSVKTGYQAEVLNMTVEAVTRVAPAGITATLDSETFISYVTPELQEGEEESEEANNGSGTYTTTYDGSAWDISLTDLGLSVSGTPVSGDSITILYDGENAPSITQVDCPRYADPAITAMIDRDTFVGYVNASGTITLSYSNGWSAAPSLYGITITGTSIDGDTITIGYVKEDRGVITNSNPTAFKSTGWNLYNHTNGYAKVLKYSDTHGFIIGGTYTAVQFSETLAGDKSTITPVEGHFSVASDGYVWVTGGNATDTYILMEWSDWTEGYEGDWKAYEESVVDLSSAMSNFPYGLMSVGSVYDEININMGYAYSRVNRLSYSAANLAYAKATGLKYDTDRDYIYIPRETVETYSISIDGSHTACDHGMEIITGTTVSVYVQTLYGQNLVDKLRTDVLTISSQSLTDSQKNQVCQNLGINRGTLRKIPLAIAVADWTAITGGFKATFTSSYITTTCDWTVVYDSSYRTYAKTDVMADLKSGGGALEFITVTKPTGTITGTIRVFDNDDGKLPVVFQNTVGSIENGYTGQSSLAGIKQAFGITNLESKLANYSVDGSLGNYASNPNFNNITTPGRYYGSGNFTNGPVSSGTYVMYVIPRDMANRVYQILYLYDAAKPKEYLRVQNGESSFTDWYCDRDQIEYATITDFNDFKPSSTSYERKYGKCGANSGALNDPFPGVNYTFIGYVEGTSTYCTQHFIVEYVSSSFGSKSMIMTRTYNSTYGWGTWNTLRQWSTAKTIEKSGGTLKMTIPIYSSVIVTIFGYREASIGVAMIITTSNGNIVTKWLGNAPSNISITTNSSNEVTITNNDSSSGVVVRAEQFHSGIVLW